MPRSIVVGTDGSKPAEEAVRQATDIASREGARLYLVAAYPDPQVLREKIAGAASTMNVDPARGRNFGPKARRAPGA